MPGGRMRRVNEAVREVVSSHISGDLKDPRIGFVTEIDDLGGYIVVRADSLDAAKDLAKGCPGLAGGGRVEVGEIVPS